MTRLAKLCSTAGHHVGRFCADESGATAIEYAMIAAGVGAAIASTVMTMGSTLKGTFYDKLAGMFP